MEKAKKRATASILVAGFLALMTGVFFIALTGRLQQQWGDTVAVVVARVDIPARTPITTDLVELQEIPRMVAHNSYLLDFNDLQGEPIALTNIPKGSIVQRNMLDHNAGLEPGYRAVSVDVNRVQSVGGSIRPGNRVDIIVTYEEGEGDAQVLKTELLFQDVLVLGVSLYQDRDAVTPGLTEEEIDDGTPSPTPTPQPLPAARFSPTGELLSEATVTLALPIEEAVKLVHMHNIGQDLRFVIRRLDEKEVPPLEAVDLQIFRR